MLYAGRFILGTSVGSACIVAPIYAAEICQKEIRGGVGTYFQLLLGTGTLFSFVIGSLVEVFWLSLICATVGRAFSINFPLKRSLVYRTKLKSKSFQRIFITHYH